MPMTSDPDDHRRQRYQDRSRHTTTIRLRRSLLLLIETQRRHVVATQLVLIGKEANQMGESGEVDPLVGPLQEFGVAR